MLVLSRKPDERILIGADIVIQVVRIGPNQVRLGITAPPELHIVREELALTDAEMQKVRRVVDRILEEAL
jgi:carbon storage regulator